jgi:hypothetical protein
MPTTIDSAGITFNDATTLTSANIGTAQLVNGAVIASKLGTNEQKQICKAWVNFNGTTSPGTIRSSYNVSSVTKNGTGDYTVNFTSAMADANYSVSCSIQSVFASTSIVVQKTGTNPTVSSCSFFTLNTGFSVSDTPFVFVSIFGN